MPDNVRIGIIGCGIISGAHLQGIAKLDGVEAAAVCDKDGERASKTAGEFGVPRTYTDWRDLVDDDDIDAVVVALPEGLHRKVTVEAAARGRHVLVEKPMGLNLAECGPMIEAAKHAGTVLMVGQVVRRFENHAVGKRWIDEGRIGKITKIVRRRQRKNGGPTMQRRPWLSDPAMAADWLLYGFGSHEYDAILWLAGADATSAQATGESAGPEWAGWKTISSGMKLANGIEAECAMSTCAEVNVWDTVITGTDGTLTIDKQSLTLNGETTEVPTDDMEAFVVQMGEFAECVRTGREPGPSGRNVRATMALLEALRTSLEEGRPVDIADIES